MDGRAVESGDVSAPFDHSVERVREGVESNKAGGGVEDGFPALVAGSADGEAISMSKVLPVVGCDPLERELKPFRQSNARATGTTQTTS